MITDKIKLLPDALANQIAAGEVVQRPASAVKELLENSVDAGATQIKLVLRDAGKTLIQVIDNGSGMSETDARMCFERHATSKIATSDDLFNIKTLGFRGEALASIAAVAQVELKTKPKNAELGTYILIEGMEVKQQQPISCPEGTNLAIKNLFFNIPARRNFLKTDSIELRHIIDEFTRVAMAYPAVAFSLLHNENEIYNLPIATLRKRVGAIMGGNSTEKLIPVEEDTNFVRIYGFVGQPDVARKLRGEQYLFVNERFIKSQYINHAITTAYDELLPDKTFPAYALFLHIDPKRVDINVHPTKQEIKFDDERIIYTFVNAAVRRALAGYCLTPSLDFESEVGFMNQQPIALKHTQNDEKTSADRSLPNPKLGINLDQNRQQNISFEKTQTPTPQQHRQNIPTNWRELYKIAEKNKYSENSDLSDLDNQEIDPTNPENNSANSYIPKNPTLLPSSDNSIVIQSDFDKATTLFGKKSETDLQSSAKPYQIHLSYILISIKSGFILIDQQAAHERVLFEQYSTQLQHSPIVGQTLLFPQTIELSKADAQLLRDILPQINALGYDIQEFGPASFILRAKPADAIIEQQTESEQAAIENLLEQFKQQTRELNTDKYARIAQAIARHHAIKKGRRLTETEMQNLADQLFACQTPFVAPNGRPTFISYPLSDIERLFQK